MKARPCPPRWHFLCLRRSDPEARLEDHNFWREDLRYCGRGRWQIRASGCDEKGRPRGERIIEPFSNTLSLIDWTFEWDSNDGALVIKSMPEHEVLVESDNADVADDPKRILGPRGTRLLKIAKTERARKCQRILEAWVARGRPEKSKPPSPPKPPRIIRITGVTSKYIWFGLGRAVFTVETTAGNALLYPATDGIACLSFPDGHPSHSVRVTPRLAKELTKHQSALTALEERLRSGKE